MSCLREVYGAALTGSGLPGLGWQPHTVRGFLAGLKKRQGIAVEVLDRVRQVGPIEQGSKGSYSVHREVG